MDSASVQRQFMPVLFEPLLEPLADAFGEYGELAASAFSQALAAQWERTP